MTPPDDPQIVSEAWERLRDVYDPEIALSLVDLGLIYRLESAAGHVAVTMSLTTPGCPMTEAMPPAVRRALEPIPGVADVNVDLVWDPPWTPEMISAEGRMALGW